ncbi:MAG: SusD/RagB family nutrient-binding outer membrane lipoprotein [Sphingobacteriales bacterium]|nr:SusD/RagB family nutrient-binding outer membrane lipoprotein [Sphingobacteriales bacterium]
MKKNLIYVSLSLLLLGTSGCEKLEDFGNTNLDPAATTQPVPQALLTNAQASIGGYASQTRGGLYAQYFSETQYTDVSVYSTPQLAFTGEYSGILTDLQIIRNVNSSNNMSQVARILQQYVFWTITDRWGDVPYSEALQGASKTTPKYDTQKDIYEGMIANLKAAVAAFDGTSAIQGDIIFNGNVAAWKRAANSMRMLMAIQLSKKYPAAGAYAATAFSEALNDGGGYISTNAQNMVMDYPGGNFKSNWWSLYNGRKDYAESKTMTDLMASLSDTRQLAFGGITQDQTAANAAVTSNIGVPYGVARATAEAFTSANTGWARILRGDFRTESSDIVVISAAQVALARAEAAERGWTSESLSTLYDAGITLSYGQWGISLPAGYLAANAVGAVGTAGNVEKISIQRYIASYPNGLQAWNIWRKSGFPTLTPAPNATNTSGQIPRRYTYSSGEYTSNGVNVNAAKALLPGGLDSQDAKIWWDQ